MNGVQDVLACVRLLAPQLEEKADSVLEAYIGLAEPFVDAEKFGPFYVQALANYAAHLMTIQSVIATDGATGGALTAGSITSEREGDLQRSYGNAGASSDDLLAKTAYGKAFLAIRRRCIVPIKTRMG